MKIDLNKFNVLYDNIFVKGIEIEERDGIVRPTSYEDKPELGEVLRIGTGRLLDNGHLEPLKLMVGDLVYFNKYSSTKFNYDGVDYYVIKEEDCVAYQR